jgi:hypothetical protein
MTHLLVILQRYYKMLGPTIKIDDANLILDSHRKLVLIFNHALNNCEI